MASDSRVAAILCPGLQLPPVADARLPGRLPALELLHARGERHLVSEAAESLLFTLFGLPAATPSAPVALLGEGEDPGQAWWSHADPVNLTADQRRIYLSGWRDLELGPAETASLVETFNTHFAADGLHLCAPAPERWYLRSEAPLAAESGHPRSVLGRALERGANDGVARRWRAVQSEVEMLLHTSAVNSEREATGRPVVSGIWGWGAGRLPDVAGAPRWDTVLATAPLARGLATLCGVALVDHEVPVAGSQLAWFEPLPRGPKQLAGWLAQVQTVEELLNRTIEQLRQGQLERIDCFTAPGKGYSLTRPALRRFWRRRRPLALVLRR